MWSMNQMTNFSPRMVSQINNSLWYKEGKINKQRKKREKKKKRLKRKKKNWVETLFQQIPDLKNQFQMELSCSWSISLAFSMPKTKLGLSLNYTKL